MLYKCYIYFTPYIIFLYNKSYKSYKKVILFHCKTNSYSYNLYDKWYAKPNITFL